VSRPILERSVHALMSAVLLWLSRLDQLGHHAELEQP